MRILTRTCKPFAAVFCLLPLPAMAQLQAEALLKRAAAANGVESLRTLKYSAAGSGAGPGQPYTAGKTLPRQNVSVTRSIDYDAAALSDDWVRSRLEQRGGTGVPLTGEQRVTEAVRGELAWNVVNKVPAAGARFIAERMPQVWLNPHGIIKAAQRSNATLDWQTRGNKSIAVVSFNETGKYRAKAYLDEQYRVERIDAVVPNAVLGDMPVSVSFSEYRDFGKVRFPGRIEERQAGQTTLNLIVTDVQPNAKVDIALPEAVAKAAERVDAQKAGDGIWFLAGGSHNSVLIEMKDHVIVVEGPLFDGRALPVIAEVKKLAPNKPIRYVVNSHVHFDHSGGLGAFVAEGATVVTHATNRAFFQKAFAAPRTLIADRYTQAKRKPEFKTVTDKAVLSDGARTVEVHHIRGNIHNDGMLMAYLPKEKILIEADVYTPAPPNAPPPAKPAATTVNLVENVQRLKLDVDRVLPLHGRIVPGAEMFKAAGK